MHTVCSLISIDKVDFVVENKTRENGSKDRHHHFCYDTDSQQVSMEDTDNCNSE